MCASCFYIPRVPMNPSRLPLRLILLPTQQRIAGRAARTSGRTTLRRCAAGAPPGRRAARTYSRWATPTASGASTGALRLGRAAARLQSADGLIVFYLHGVAWWARRSPLCVLSFLEIQHQSMSTTLYLICSESHALCLSQYLCLHVSVRCVACCWTSLCCASTARTRLEGMRCTSNQGRPQVLLCILRGGFRCALHPQLPDHAGQGCRLRAGAARAQRTWAGCASGPSQRQGRSRAQRLHHSGAHA